MHGLSKKRMKAWSGLARECELSIDRSKRRSLRCPALILERSQVFVFPCFWMKDKSDLPDGESLGKRKRKKNPLVSVFFMRENVEGIGCCCFSNERWSDYANVLLPKISYRRVQNLFLLLLVCWFESQSDVLVFWKLCPGIGVKKFREEGRGFESRCRLKDFS